MSFWPFARHTKSRCHFPPISISICVTNFGSQSDALRSFRDPDLIGRRQRNLSIENRCTIAPVPICGSIWVVLFGYQFHLIPMWYSCYHCQSIDFVELSQAHNASPALNGPQSQIRLLNTKPMKYQCL